jgi:DNA-binding IclR family transcriptional regulator
MSPITEQLARTVTAAPVPAVTRALAVMDLLARERRPMNPTGLAAALHLPKSSVHNLCNTLLLHGWLRRAENGALQIGPGVMSLAEAFVASTDVAREFNALCSEASPSDETLLLSVRHGTEVVYIAVRESPRPLGLSFNVGMRLPVQVTATGKVMLAWCDDDGDELRRLWPRGASLPGLPGQPAVSRASLQRELQLTRQRGYAIDDGGVREGVYSIAAPVFDAAGHVAAGLAMCMNKSGLGSGQREQQRRAVLDLARRLSQRLGARVEPA